MSSLWGRKLALRNGAASRGMQTRRQSHRHGGHRARFEPLEPRMVLAANVVISEILADNDTGLEDEDGDRVDWIELFNAGDMTANLDGWHLTDDATDLSKWRFPDVDLAPDDYLVVFASDKNRIAPTGPLHANFKLTSNGEYLALVEPDASTVAFEFAPKFPAQLTDLSFGLAQAADATTFIGPQAQASVLVPTSGTLGTSWRDIGFDDSAWRQGTTGIGYERGSGYENLIRLDVEAEMAGLRTTAYVRIPFTVEASDSFSSLLLRMKYDDGFVAFINGVEVARANAPGALAWDSQAPTTHDDGAAVIFQDFDITAQRNLLVDGQNVLAIHGLNRGTGSSDFLLVPELTGVVAQDIQVDVRHFLVSPTPGAPNGVGAASVVEAVEFSVPGGVITGNTTLELSTPTPGADIRFTLNGSLPGETSTLYTGAINIGGSSTMVRASGFAPDALPSRPVSETYLVLAADVQRFSSDLPVVILENFGGGSVPSSGFQTSSLTIFEQVDGRTTLDIDPTLQTRSGIRIRGSSTLNRPKKAYNVEAWDNNDHDKQISPLGLPRESDFILYAAYNFDRALMRNALIYDLSNQVGRYAVRTRFVEVFVNTGGGAVSQSDYAGVYSFMEKIKRDKNRVDIEELTPFNNAQPEVTGGYILKIDRLDPGDSGFSAGGQRLAYVEPKETEVTSQQAAWIKGYIDQFVNVLNGPNFADPVSGYAKYIDVDSWIDHHILNVLAKNVDAFRLSGYMFIDRLGKLQMGPIWDFDRSMESTDGRDDNPRTWDGTGDATRFFDYPWWDRLFDDPNFWQKWIDRWTELRTTTFSVANIDGTIDGMADEIREAQVRNFQKWTSVPPRFGSFQGEVNHLKGWLQDRVEWIDTNFVTAPSFSHGGGQVDPGLELTISGTGEVFYTTDGSDPRLPGGAVNPNAILLGQGAVTTLVTDNSAVEVLIPTDGSLGGSWRNVGFGAAGWINGTAGVGYELASGYEALINTDVESAMFNNNATAYVRVPFTASDADDFDTLTLRMKYDDAFVAYLNGTEVARSANVPAALDWNSAATGLHADSAALVFENFDISAHVNLLVDGDNVLAIHGLNAGAGSSDFLIVPEIVASSSTDSRVTIDQNTIVTARTRSGSSWSGLTEATFLVGDPPPLRVTEIMYDPPGGEPFPSDEYEFIELQNVGASTISLAGMNFVDGIRFAFPDIDLAAGERVVIVENQDAFRSRYGMLDTVIGQYTGQLANGGERLLLTGAFDETILDFESDDIRTPETNGGGHSLVIIDALADPITWNYAESWKPSAAVNGSPGIAEPSNVPGDTNGDGVVNIDDLNNVRNNFGGAGLGDTNGDGVVNIDDLNNVRNNFGAGAAAAIATVAPAEIESTTEAAADLRRLDARQTHRRRLRLANRREASFRVTVGAGISEPGRVSERSVFRASRGHAARNASIERDVWDFALLDMVSNEGES